MIHSQTSWTVISLAIALICGVTTPFVLLADDLDQELLKSLEEGRQPDSVVTIVNRLLDNTTQAQARLADSDFQKQTQTLQQQILEDIDALLEQTTPPPGSPPPSSGESESQTQNDQSHSSESQQTEGDGAEKQSPEEETSSDPNAESRESAERNAQANGGATEQKRRLGLATAVWGHLPPKVREQMRSAFSETYLPEYDDLVRRYYEALAARRDRHQNRGSE